MPIISIFSGGFCQEDTVIEEVVARTGYGQITDDEIVAEASRRSTLAESKIKRAFSSKTSVFNKFTFEKERSLAYIKLAVADLIATDNALITNFSGQLIPATISHTLRVCLIAPQKYRTAAAAEQRGISEKDAAKLVQRREEDCAFWVDTLFSNSDPWNPALYDIVIPVDKMSPQDAAALIVDNAGKDIIQPTADSKQALEDFRLAAEALHVDLQSPCQPNIVQNCRAQVKRHRADLFECLINKMVDRSEFSLHSGIGDGRLPAQEIEVQSDRG